jgi:MFS family permease
MATIAAEAPAPLAGFSPAELARQRRWVLGIVNVSHGFNHANSGMMPILFGAMMGPLGFGFAELGYLSAAHNIVSQSMQAVYGVVAQFARRSVILGLGNLLLGVTTMLTGFTQGFSQLVMLRAMSGAGSSPQHPVGSTMLSTWFGAARGRALGLHNTAGQAGSFLAIPLVTAMLVIFDWRVIMILIGIPSLLMGLSYFLLRDVVQPAPAASGRVRAKAGMAAYVACFKNRDLMLVTLIMTIGAAGRGAGINQTYLVPHFAYDLNMQYAVATSLLMILQAGALVAPMAWGYLSDLFPRKLVMQASLFLSALTTVWLGSQDSLGLLLLANLAIYGLVVHARQAITQAMVGDYAGEDVQDAAFSIYFTIGLVSGPLWTIIMGQLMATSGFEFAARVVATSYIAAMLLLIPLRLRPQPARTEP